MILTWIAYGSLLISIGSFFIAYSRHEHFYWLAAIGMYLFSFLAGFSIGTLTVGLTFIPLTLAFTHLFGIGNNRKEHVVSILIGTLIGLLVVLFVRQLIFYPLLWLLSPLLN